MAKSRVEQARPEMSLSEIEIAADNLLRKANEHRAAAPPMSPEYQGALRLAIEEIDREQKSTSDPYEGMSPVVRRAVEKAVQQVVRECGAARTA